MSEQRAKAASLAARVGSVAGSVRAHLERSVPDPALPRTSVGMVLFVLAQAVALALFVRYAKKAMTPFRTAPPLPPIAAPTSMTRFGMTESVRREVFRELAESESTERQRALTQNTWNGHLWSRFDDLGYVQRARGRELALRYNITLTQVYLVLDEGIRERWPGPDGQPLSPLIEPLQLRSE